MTTAQKIFEKTQKITSNDLEMTKHLLLMFFDELKMFKQNITNLTEVKDMNGLQHLFHKLSGSCGYFGADELRAQAMEMETITKKNDWLEFGLNLPNFQQEMKNVLAQEDAIKKILG